LCKKFLKIFWIFFFCIHLAKLILFTCLFRISNYFCLTFNFPLHCRTVLRSRYLLLFRRRRRRRLQITGWRLGAAADFRNKFSFRTSRRRCAKPRVRCWAFVSSQLVVFLLLLLSKYPRFLSYTLRYCQRPSEIPTHHRE